MSIEALERALASTEQILSKVSTDQMEQATPCASWTVRNLVNHIVGSSHWYAATVETGVAPDRVEGGSGTDVTGGDFVAAFGEGSRRTLAAFRAAGAMEKPLQLPFGEIPAGVFLMMSATDQFQHGWDLAKATGQATALDPDLARELLEFVRVALPDAFRGPEGQALFGPVVPVPESASPVDQLAGFSGRTP